MSEGSIPTTDLPSCVLDGLFDSFGKETISDDDDVSNETVHGSGSIFVRYSNACDDKVTA